MPDLELLSNTQVIFYLEQANIGYGLVLSSLVIIYSVEPLGSPKWGL